MIHVGDYVQIREEFMNMYWYTEEVYRVVSISGETLTLNEKLPVSPLHNISEKDQFKIHESNVQVNLTTTRYYKIENLFGK